MTSHWLGEYLEGSSTGSASPTRNPRRERKSRWAAAPTQNELPSHDELSVIGYSCKFYRDDEHATQVNSGSSLVPWMGDATLHIDRFDGRALISDLRPYDADLLPSTPAQLDPVLAEEERLAEIERYCDLTEEAEERALIEDGRCTSLSKRLPAAVEPRVLHRALAHDGARLNSVHAVRVEEEQKRERQSERGGYAAVPPPSQSESAPSATGASGTSSPLSSISPAASSSQAGDSGAAAAVRADSPSAASDATQRAAGSAAEDAELARLLEDTPFQCPMDLHIPPEITPPRTMREHLVIEKTASFVARQGAQMEIVLKAKGSQSRLEFLEREHALHAYYKHLVQQMKLCLYVPALLHYGTAYLRASPSSAQASSTAPLAAAAASVTSANSSTRATTASKSISVDSPYAKLIEKFRSTYGAGTAASTTSTLSSASSSAATQSTSAPKTSSERAPSPSGSESNSEAPSQPPPPPPTTGTSTEQVPTISTPSNNSQPTTSATNSASLSTVPQQPPPELMRSLGQLSSPQDYANVMKNYAHDAHTVFYLQSWWDTYYAPYYGPLPPPDLTAAAAVGPNAANGTAASSTQAPAPPLVEPPPNVRSVIDKLAEYVARNGEEFEQRVSQKGDQRFAFLSLTHEHHTYYRTRVAAERDKRERADAGRSKAREEAIPVLKTPGGRPLLPITAFEVTLSPAFGIRSKTPRLAKTDHKMFADDETDEQTPAASVPSAVAPVSTVAQNALQTTNEDSNATAHSPAAAPAAAAVSLTQPEDLSLAIDGVPLAPSSGSPPAAPSPALSPKDEQSDNAETGSGRRADRRRKAAEFLAGLISAQPSVGSAIDDFGASVESGAAEDESSHELHLTELVSNPDIGSRTESKRRKFHE